MLGKFANDHFIVEKSKVSLQILPYYTQNGFYYQISTCDLLLTMSKFFFQKMMVILNKTINGFKSWGVGWVVVVFK